MSDGTGPGSQDAIALGQLASDISFVSRILRAHLLERNAPFYEAHGVAAGEVAVLNIIGLNPGISQKSIAKATVLKKSALSKLINEMERSGLIARRKEGEDLRVNALHLTARGEEKLARLRTDMEAQQDVFLSALSPAERAMLFELIWRLIEDLGGISLEDSRRGA